MFFPQQRMIAMVLLSVILSACSANTIYRDDLSYCESESLNRCENHAISNHNPNSDKEFYLGFVEFDDQGQLHERAQMETLLEKYYQIAGSEDDVIITVFVHGWHHSAAAGDDNVESFKKLLTQISTNETRASQQEQRAKRKILGVYIGWRGDSLTIPWVNHLTFWERKNTAQKIGSQGAIEVLLKLEEIVNVKAGFETEPRPLKSRLVVIGHSFGGAIVYTALQQVLADRFVNSKLGKTFQDTARGFGSLVVLLNPAFEAMRFSTLFDMSQDGCRRYFEQQVPRLILLTSEADYATRLFFSLGRRISTVFETHQGMNRHICTRNGNAGKIALTIEESSADRTAIGHFEPYRTHRLTPMLTNNLNRSDLSVESLKWLWSKQYFGNQLDFSDTQLTHLGRTDPLNPYLNIYVDRSLIKDHNAIWGESVLNFVSKMIVISTALITE